MTTALLYKGQWGAAIRRAKPDLDQGEMMSLSSIIVRARWDPEAEVWVATSDDVPGLVTEASTPAELERKLQEIIPELLEENEQLAESDRSVEVPLFVMSEQVSKVRLRT